MKESNYTQLPKNRQQQHIQDREALHHSSLLRTRHHHLPEFNRAEHSLTSFDELHTYPSVCLSTPQAAYVSDQRCEQFDVCHRRTVQRDCHRQRLHMSGTTYHGSKRKNRRLHKMGKKDVHHLSVYDLATRLEADPDPYFHGSYDYFYTGGSLCVLQRQSAEQGEPLPVIHIDGGDLRNLNASQFSPSGCYYSPTLNVNCTRLAPDTSSELYEMRPLRGPCAADKRTHLLAGRQRHCITLFWLLEEKDILVHLTQFKSEECPLNSFAQPSSGNNLLAVSSMKQRLLVFDIETSEVVYETSVNSSAKHISWNVLRPWQDGNILYANEQELRVADFRCSADQWLAVRGCFNTKQVNCDAVSNVAGSRMCPQLIYVATTHKLQCFDVRCMPSHSWQGAHTGRSGVVSCWTHQLEYPPIFMDTLLRDNSEIVALSSAMTSDLRLCELTASTDFRVPSTSNDASSVTAYVPHSLPYQPPTLQEAYVDARSHGLSLQPEADLVQRLRAATTGLCFMAQPETSPMPPFLLSSNSNGDVFASVLRERRYNQTFDEERTNSASDEIVERYAQRVCERVQPRLHHTELIDISDIRKFLQSEKLDSPRKAKRGDAGNADIGIETLPTAGKQRGRLGGWQKSIQTLHAYKDALVPDLLTIWDIDYKEEKDLKLRHLDKLFGVKRDPDAMINTWLKAEPRLDHVAPMVSVPAASFKDTEAMQHNTIADNSQSYFNDGLLPPNVSTQTVADISLLDSSAMERGGWGANDTSLPSGSILAKPKKVKRKYVKGF